MATAKLETQSTEETKSNTRQELDQEIETLQNEVPRHAYLDAVSQVNRELLERDVPIGPHMTQAVRTNLEEIRQGTGSLPTYHAREVVALTRDGVNCLREEEYREAAIHVVGVVGNGAAFFASGALEHQARARALGNDTQGTRSTTMSDNEPSTDSSREGCCLM